MRIKVHRKRASETSDHSKWNQRPGTRDEKRAVGNVGGVKQIQLEIKKPEA